MKFHSILLNIHQEMKLAHIFHQFKKHFNHLWELITMSATEEGEVKRTDLRVELHWHEYDTGLFTEKLYRHVRRDEAEFRLEASPGSLETQFAVAFIAGSASKITVDIAKYLLKRRIRARSNEREASDTKVIVLIDGEEYEVNVQSEEDVNEVKRLARRKAEVEQSELDDF